MCSFHLLFHLVDCCPRAVEVQSNSHLVLALLRCCSAVVTMENLRATQSSYAAMHASQLGHCCEYERHPWTQCIHHNNISALAPVIASSKHMHD